MPVTKERKTQIAEKEKKRREERVTIALPLRLANADYVTHDISPLGVYFEAKAPFELGGRVNFVVKFINYGGDLTLKCNGEIVRREVRNGRVGVAVRILESIMMSA